MEKKQRHLRKNTNKTGIVEKEKMVKKETGVEIEEETGEYNPKMQSG